MKDLPTTEERIWSVLSHLSALAFGMGILLPILGWSEQRRKSKYSSFQCLQALGYQSLGFTVWLLSYLIVFIAILVVIIIMSYQAEQNGQTFDPFAGPIRALIYIAVFGFLAIYVLGSVFAAIACGLGKDFRFPIMGDRLARYLGYPHTQDESAWLLEDHEDRWVVAMGHFSVIILLWGLLAPLTAWMTQGKRSAFLRFQSIQTVIYQAGVTILYLGAIFVYLFGIFGLIAVLGLAGSPGNNAPMGMFGAIIFLIVLLVASLIILVVPLFHILGQWAGYRVLKGDNYRYPFVGKLAEKWMANKTSLAADGGLSVEGKTT